MTARLWINGILTLLAIGILLCSQTIFSNHSEYLCERGEEGEVLHNATLFAGIFMWPVVWDLLIGYHTLNKHPSLVIAFMWPIVVTFYQAVDAKYDNEEDLSDVNDRRKNNIMGVQGDASTLISIAFAMGGIFMVMPSLTENKDLLKGAAYIVVVALLICIALILPTANYVVNSRKYTYVLRNMQRVAINYALGLIMAALITVIVTRERYTKKGQRIPTPAAKDAFDDVSSTTNSLVSLDSDTQ